MAKRIMIPVSVFSNVTLSRLGTEGRDLYLRLLAYFASQAGIEFFGSDLPLLAQELKTSPEYLETIIVACLGDPVSKAQGEPLLSGSLEDGFYNEAVTKDCISYQNRCAANRKNIESRYENSTKPSTNGKRFGSELVDTKVSTTKLHVPVSVSVDVNNTNKKIAAKRIQFGDYVHFTEAEIEKHTNELSPETFKACWEKLDAWIASDPTPKRKRNGWNASATLRSWVIRAVTEERERLPAINGRSPPQQRLSQNAINVQRTLATAKRFKELEKYENNADVEDSIESLPDVPKLIT